MAETTFRPPTKEELELAIFLGRKVVIPTVKLLIGRFRKKSVEMRLLYGAVFTFYDSIPIEDYYSVFVKKILESKVDKRKLEVDGLTVNYSISPNVKATYPVVLEAEYGSKLLDEEMIPMHTSIDQIRFFVFPTQEEISLEGLQLFAKAFDNFLDKIEFSLRQEKQLPLNMVVKHLILESENGNFLEKASKTISNDKIRVHRSDNKVTVTYIKVEGMLAFIRNLG